MIRLAMNRAKEANQELNGRIWRIKGISMTIIGADKCRFDLGSSSMEEADTGRKVEKNNALVTCSRNRWLHKAKHAGGAKSSSSLEVHMSK